MARDPKSIVSICAGGVTYKVKQRAKIKHDHADDPDKECNGLSDHEKCIIFIERGLQPDTFQYMLDHERGHAIMVQSGARQALSPYLADDADVFHLEETFLQIFLPICLDSMRRVRPDHPKFLRTVYVNGIKYRIKRLAKVIYKKDMVDSYTDHKLQEIRIDRALGIEAYQAALAISIGHASMHQSGCRQALSAYIKDGVRVTDMEETLMQIFIPSYIDSLRRDTYKGDAT